MFGCEEILIFQQRVKILKKGILEFRRTATIKPRQIELSGFFLLEHNGQTQVYRLFSGQSDIQLWRKRDFPTKDDVCACSTLRHTMM